MTIVSCGSWLYDRCDEFSKVQKHTDDSENEKNAERSDWLSMINKEVIVYYG